MSYLQQVRKDLQQDEDATIELRTTQGRVFDLKDKTELFEVMQPEAWEGENAPSDYNIILVSRKGEVFYGFSHDFEDYEKPTGPKLHKYRVNMTVSAEEEEIEVDAYSEEQAEKIAFQISSIEMKKEVHFEVTCID